MPVTKFIIEGKYIEDLENFSEPEHYPDLDPRFKGEEIEMTDKILFEARNDSVGDEKLKIKGFWQRIKKLLLF